LIKLLSLI